MKKTISLFLLAVLSGSLTQAADTKPFATIVRVEGSAGNAYVERAGSRMDARAGSALSEGDTVITGNGAAVVLREQDGTTVNIAARSSLTLSSKSNYLEGWARFIVEKSPEKKVHYRVKSSAGTMGVRGTEFVVNASNSGKCDLFTVVGSVLFGNESADMPSDTAADGASIIEVAAGMMSSVAKGGSPENVRPFDRRILDDKFDILSKDMDEEFLKAGESERVDRLMAILNNPAEFPVSHDTVVKAYLNAAVHGKTKSFVAILSKDKSLLGAVDERGRTALHMAAKEGRLAIVKHLLSKDANMDPMAKDQDGRTALDLAELNNQKAVVKFLKGVK